MASGIATPDPKPAATIAAGGASPSSFIDRQLQRTRRQVKLVEIAGGLLTLAVGALAFFLLAAILDHWIISRGLGQAHRWLLLLAFLAGVGYYFAKIVAPVLWGRINPIYAAQAIERSKPTIKNSLINFLLFRRQSAQVPQIVYQALEQQAATKLVDVSIETAVDRSHLVHRGYLLVGLSAAFALYLILSPKNPLTTMRRLLAPWADVPAPSRVTILDVSPGDTTAFRGHAVDVSAEILGVRDSDEVRLVYSSADRQITERIVPMAVPTGGYRYAAKLPEGVGGIQQDLEYRIEAGDTISKTYRIQAVAAPAIVVKQVEYHYPSYTGLRSTTVENIGDLKAIEGTEVVLRATANQPIAAASIDFNCDGTLDRSMKVDGQNATLTFPLTLSPSRSEPLFNNYQLRFTNEQKVANPEPIRHHVEVIPDLAPEIRITAPEQEEIEVPLDGSVKLEVQAIDPDFALQSVMLQARNDRKTLLEKRQGELLAKAPHRGPLTKSFEFAPAKFGAKVGDVIHFRATAVDVKSPRANQSTTSEKRIRIVAPESKEPRRGADQNREQQPQDPMKNPDPQPDRQNDSNQDPRQKPADAGDRSDKNQDQAQPPSGESQENREPQNRDQESSEQTEQSEHRGENEQQNSSNQSSKGESGQSGDQSDVQSGQGQEGSGKEQGARQDSGGEQGNQNRSRGDGMGEQSDSPSDSGQSSDRSGQSRQERNSQNNSTSQQRGDDNTGESQSQQGDHQSADGSSKGSPQSSQQGSEEKSPVPTDPNHDGEGIERILEHQRQENGDSQGNHTQEQHQSRDGSAGKQQSEGKQQSGSQSKTGDQSGSDQRSGADQSSGAKQQPGSDSSPEQGKSGTEGSQQSQEPGSQRSGDEGGQDSPKDPRSGQQSSEKNQTSEKQPGQSPDAQTGDPQQDGTERNPSGEKQGDQTGNQSKSGQPKSDNQSRAQDNQSGEKRDAGKSGKEPGANQGTGTKQQENGEKKPDQNGPSQTDPSVGEPMDMGSKQPQEGARPGEEQSGSPMTDQGIRPDQQSSEQPNKPGSEQQGGESPSTSRDESQTKGEEPGDRSGAGDKGGGQKSDQPGMNTPGQNTLSDQGAGRSNEEGIGESSDLPGNQKKSEQPTGQQGNEEGQGSASRPSNDKSGKSQRGADNQRGQQQPDRSDPSQDKTDGSPSQEGSESPSGSKSGQPNNAADGRSQHGRDPNSQAGPQDTAPINPEDPNLDYAKKATELALKHLKDAMKRSDGDKLLNDLGWSREDAERFIQRQEERLRAASRSNPDDNARRDAEDVLRSLGIRNPSTARAGVGTTRDRQHGLSSDRRTAPPPEYREQFRAFSQGINQSGQ